MISKSEQFNNAFKSSHMEIFFRVTINDVTYEKDKISNAELNYQIASDGGLMIGSMFSNGLNITFTEVITTFNELDEVYAEIGVLLANRADEVVLGVEWDSSALSGMVRTSYLEEWANDRIEYCPLGTFVISERVDVNRNDMTTSIFCLDNMALMEGAYESSLTYPAPIRDVALEIANKSGMTINTTNFSRLSTNTIKKIEGATYRQAIGMIAQLEAGYALFNRQGELEIRTLNNTEFEISPDHYRSKGLVKNDLQYRLGGISVDVDDDESTLQAGSTQGSQISLENSVMTQQLLNNIYSKIENINFYPFTLEWWGNPALEVGDWVLITDLEGNEFKAPVLNYKLKFDGGISSTISADVETTSNHVTTYKPPLKQKLQKLGLSIANNKGEVTYFGLDAPIEPKNGDRWYKMNGPDEEFWIYVDGEWKEILSKAVIKAIQQEILDALNKAEEAKIAAEDAYTNAVTEAERLVDEQSEAFDAKLEAETSTIRDEIEQGYNAAVAEAERLVTVQDTIYQEIFEGYDSAVGDLTGSIAEADNKATDALEQAGVSSSLAQTAKEASERAETSASQAHAKAEEAIVKADNATTKADDMLATIETFEPIVTDAQAKAEEAITKANGIPDTISDIIVDKGLVSGDWVDTRIDDVTGEINYELTNVKGDIPVVIMGFEWNAISDPTLVRTDYVEDYANLDEYNLNNAEFNLSIDGIKTNITTIERNKLDTSVYSTFKNNEYANDVNGIRQRITHVETNKLDDEEFRTFKEHDYEVTVGGLSGKIQVIEDEKLDGTEFDLFKSNDYQLTVDGFSMELSNISGSVPDYVLGVEWDRGSDPVFDRTDFMTESPTLSEYTVKTAEYDTSIDGLKVGLDQVQTKKLDGDIFTTFKSNDYDVTIGGLSGRILEVETDKLDTSDFNSFKSNDYEVTVAGFSGDITEIKRDKMNTSSFNTFKTNVFDVTVNGLNGRIESVEFDKLDTSDFTNFKSNEYQTTVDGMAGQITAIERDKLDTVDFDSFKSNDYQLTVDGFNMELTNISGSVPDYVLGVEWDLSENPTLIRTNYVEEVDLTNYDNPDYVMGIEWDGVSNPILTRTDNTEDLTSKKEFEVFLGDYNFSAEGWNATNTYVTNNKTQINNLVSNADGWQQTISYVDANQTKFNETISQVDSYKQTIGSNGEKITQMVMTDNAFITKVGELEGLAEDVILGVEWERASSSVMARTGYMDDWTETQVAQLSGSWVLTIKSGSDIKTQINATTDGIRLESKLTHLAGDSLIDNAVIKSSHINTLSVSKLVGTTAEFTTLRGKVITADSITSEYLKVDNALIDKLTVNRAMVERFFSKEAVIDNLSVKTLDAITANITSIRSEVLVAGVVEATHLKADTTLIDKLFATTALINQLTSKTAFINSVKAIDISAARITTGTLNAANVNIINLNVSNLVGDTSNFVQSAWNGIDSNLTINSSGLTSNSSNGTQYRLGATGVEYIADGTTRGVIKAYNSGDGTYSGEARGVTAYAYRGNEFHIGYQGNLTTGTYLPAITVHGTTGDIGLLTSNIRLSVPSIYPNKSSTDNFKFNYLSLGGITMFNNNGSGAGIDLYNDGSVAIRGTGNFVPGIMTSSRTNSDGLKITRTTVSGVGGYKFSHSNANDAGIIFADNGYVYIKSTSGNYSVVEPNFGN